MAEPWIGNNDAARLVKLAPRTLARYRQLGTGPAYARIGNAPRYQASTVEAWIASRQVTSRAEELAKAARHDAVKPAPVRKGKTK